MSKNTSLLPKRFEDLEEFAVRWALPSEIARNQARRTSDMASLTAFYEAILPHMRDIISYLNRRSIDDFDAQEKRLLHLAFAFMEVAMAVEVFKEPDESEAFPAERYLVLESRPV